MRVVTVLVWVCDLLCGAALLKSIQGVRLRAVGHSIVTLLCGTDMWVKLYATLKDFIAPPFKAG